MLDDDVIDASARDLDLARGKIAEARAVTERLLANPEADPVVVRDVLDRLDRLDAGVARVERALADHSAVVA